MESTRIFLAIAVSLLMSACGSGLSDVECTDNNDCSPGICAAGQCIILSDGDAEADAEADAAGTDASQDVATDLGVDAVADAGEDTPAEVGEDTTDVGTDADADDSALPDADAAVDSGEPNFCGGFAVLVYDEVAANPGDACGACGDGVLVCNGVDALRCTRESEPNDCGGCGTLAGAPGTTCGACGGGQWVCTDGNVLCSGATPRNACGGCAGLEGEPGEECDADTGARWSCDGTDVAVCGGTGNACGGTAALLWEEASALPGDACADLCSDGQLVCDGRDALRCLADVEPNACGGCDELPGEIGAACGECDGALACDDAGGAFCDEPAVNACGGCAVLDGAPGASCGVGGGVWRCDGLDAVTCGGGATNACGGTTALEGAPGTSCGACDAGTWECDGTDAVMCSVGADEGLNACGGCATLSAPPGTPCGSCASGRWECSGTEALVCAGDAGDAAFNACGGCRPLVGEPGDSCAMCGVWACGTLDTTRCERPVGSTCDPCEVVGCDAESRVCNPGSGGTTATCGGCLPGYTVVDMACVLEECTSDSDCGVREVIEGECTWDSTCAGTGVRDETTIDHFCDRATCGSNVSVIDDIECTRAPPEGTDCTLTTGEAGTCSDGACILSLAAPTGVHATDGTFTDLVEVSWNAVAEANGYIVYRDDEVAGTVSSATTTTWQDRAASPGAVPAITVVDATRGTRFDDVLVSWTVRDGTAGAAHTYEVVAVRSGAQSPRSGADTGYRAAPEVSAVQLRAGAGGTWVSLAAEVRGYVDTTAPPGAIVPGAAVASDGLHDDHVALDVDRQTTTDGAERQYFVRLLVDANVQPTVGPVPGYRGVGPLGYRWQRLRSGTTTWDYLTTSSSLGSLMDDYTAPADGSRRTYRCEISAVGATTQFTTEDLGNRARCDCPSGQEWCAPGEGLCTSSRGCCAGALGCLLDFSIDACSP